MSVDFKELRELLAAIAQTDITELTLKSDEFELMVRKATTRTTPTFVESISQAETTTASSEVVSPKPPPQAAVNPPTEPDPKWVAITAPMVGTFYRAPAPDEAAFVNENERISKGQTVCIIEAMKLMNEIESELSGVVTEIAVENGSPVEYGQVLMWVNPD